MRDVLRSHARSSRRSAVLALILAPLILAPPLSSQAPAAPEEAAAGDGTFFESIDVEVVNVDVNVTDGKGNPVAGLGRDAFQLFEDGKPVEISNFYAVTGPAPAAAVPISAPAPQEKTAAAAKAETAIPEEQRLQLVVFLDNRDLTAVARNRVIAQIEKFLAGRARGTDRLLLVTYDRSLKVRQTPTDDPAALAAALRQAAHESAGDQQFAEMEHLLSDLARTPLPGSTLLANDVAPDQLRHDIEVWGQKRQDEIRSTLRSVSQLIDWLGGLPGRKALLFVSGGLSMEPAENLLNAWNTRFAGSVNQQESPLADRNLETGVLLKKIGERANAHRVTFYTLGAVESVHGISAAHAYIPEWTGGALDAQEELNRAQSLITLAADTGGLSSLNPENAVGLLERLHRELDSYYSLGFTPGHARDGKLHHLEVRLAERGLKLRYREAFRSTPREEEMKAQVLSSLALESGENPLAVALEIGKPKEEGKDEIVLPVLVRFGLADLALIPGATENQGQVRLYVAARDTKGRMSAVNEVVVPIHVTREQLKEAVGKQAGYVVQLRLRKEPCRIAVTLFDDVAKVSSTTAASYAPSPSAAAR